MNSDPAQKEALFNEVKGSLFEFLVAQNLARFHKSEKEFLESIDRNYLNVLTQQDRMVREFYPALTVFLQTMAKKTMVEMERVLGETPKHPKLMGKLVNSSPKKDWHEADLIVEVQGVSRPVSLKLNKQGAFVNTKSGGVKSFFSHYFPFLLPHEQATFNQTVDLEFERMARDLHEFHDLSYAGNFSLWVEKGFSELPGELSPAERDILKAYYARLAESMHGILSSAKKQNEQAFKESLFPLMGFSSSEMLQVICFHDFKKENSIPEIFLHDYAELKAEMSAVDIKPFGNIASVEISMGDWTLQIRIKPMNKFTTTAIKVNCSVKVKAKRPSEV